MARSSSPRLGLAGFSFALSAVLLTHEVALVRLLSYATDPRLVSGAISIAFAGLGGGSILVAVLPRAHHAGLRLRLARLSAWLGVAILAQSALFARLSPYLSAASWTAVVTRALPILLLCAIPYVLGGAALSIATTAARTEVHRVYGYGLAGSALGCFALFPFLRSLGLPLILVALAGVAALTGVAMMLGVPAQKRRWSEPLAAVALCLVGFPFATRLLPFQPDPTDLMAIAAKTYVATHPDEPRGWQPQRDFAAWDPVSRVEVFTFPRDFGLLNGEAPIKLVTQDGGAGTILVDFRGHDDAERAWTHRSVYATGYFLGPAPKRALVVGLGGGVDVVTALAHGAGQVTGIEINRTILDVSSRHFRAFSGEVLNDPRVTLVHADGRSFLEHAGARGETWDHIQMSGADTYSAGSAGAFMFSESYLYTEEAFERYLRALAPGGVLSLIRFGPEPLRTVVTASEALRRLGVRDPRRHFVVLRQGICAGIAISREPFAEASVLHLLDEVLASTRGAGVSLPMWEAMGFGINTPIQLDYVPGFTKAGLYADVLTAAAEPAALDRLLATFPLDYSPSTDDRPFFFQFLKPADWLRLEELGDDNFFAKGLLGHMRLVAGFLVLAAALTLLPLVVLRRREREATTTLRRPSALAFFGGLGLAFMLVELALIQRTGLLLGHPTYSVSVTLATLLVGSGTGAAYSRRLRARP
ncbi:MAG: hypothetical protein KC731_18240, partial [Myxococcales bacterium]|nr:hypothetical protein [Myxococcales bacterium]